MITALILAAGRSRRMGFPKALLRYAGRSLFEIILETVRAADVAAVVVVVGAEDDPSLFSARAARTLVAQTDVPRALEPRLVVGAPDRHPIDSLRSGLRAVAPDSALLLWPVDQPFASAALVRRLVETLGASPDRIVVPVVDGRTAHPVLFGPTVARELGSPVADHGAHGLVHRDPARLLTVADDDPRLVAPLNTPEEARGLGVGRQRRAPAG